MTAMIIDDNGFAQIVNSYKIVKTNDALLWIDQDLDSALKKGRGISKGFDDSQRAEANHEADKLRRTKIELFAIERYGITQFNMEKRLDETKEMAKQIGRLNHQIVIRKASGKPMSYKQTCKAMENCLLQYKYLKRHGDIHDRDFSEPLYKDIEVLLNSKYWDDMSMNRPEELKPIPLAVIGSLQGILKKRTQQEKKPVGPTGP